jgi:uncharacterized pyridoxamine 5'-phosphate oxidase family protein
LYICTNSQKEVFKQMQVNPHIEIAATASTGEGLRLSAEAYADNNDEAKQAIFDANPQLSEIYKNNRELFQVLYLKNATAKVIGLDGQVKWSEEF